MNEDIEYDDYAANYPLWCLHRDQHTSTDYDIYSAEYWEQVNTVWEILKHCNLDKIYVMEADFMQFFYD